MPAAASKPPLSDATGRLGQRVRAGRLAMGLSQERLAEITDLHWSYLGQVERGQNNLTLHIILRIAAALGVDPGELVTGLEAPPSDKAASVRRRPDDYVSPRSSGPYTIAPRQPTKSRAGSARAEKAPAKRASRQGNAKEGNSKEGGTGSAKKAPAKKTTAQKAGAKKTTAKAAAKKTTAKAAAKKTTAKKAAAKKTTAKKAAAKKGTAKKAAAKKTTAKKAAAKKGTAKKS